MRQLRILAMMLALAAMASCNFSKPSYYDRSSQERTEFTFQEHCDNMYASAQMKYDFDKYKPAQFKKWQKNFRDELKDLVGLSVIEQQLKGYKPVAEMIDSEDIGFAVRQRWQIWTEPDVNVRFVLMIPKDIDETAPLAITPHGHGANPEQYSGIYISEADSIKGVDGQRNVAYRLAQKGFITINPTARSFGNTRCDEDLKNGSPNSCSELHNRDALVGRTPVGDRVWDIMRLIDWAFENYPVDKKTVLVTGNSGGGTQTIYSSAIDERITISVPGSAFSSFEASIGGMRHCHCNYIPGIMNYGNMCDILGLVAPRPVCILQGVSDGIFPIKEARKQFEELQRIYSAATVPDNCELYEGKGGHRYYFDGAWAFIEKQLAK